MTISTGCVASWEQKLRTCPPPLCNLQCFSGVIVALLQVARKMTSCNMAFKAMHTLQLNRWTLSSWNLLRVKGTFYLADFNKYALQVVIDLKHAATCLARLRKAKDSSTFLATCNVRNCCIGCWQLTMQHLLRFKLQEKLPRVFIFSNLRKILPT